MRVTDSVTYRNFLAGLESLDEQLNTVSRQLSTGKKQVSLREAPAASAESIRLRGEAARLDQYQANADSGTLYLHVADSALSSVQNLVAAIQVKGSAAATGTASAADRAAYAVEIRSLRDQLLALANSEVNGRYIFAGSAVGSAAFSIEGDAVTYLGDGAVNSIQVGDGQLVQQNVGGGGVFTPIFGAIQSLLSALDSGTAEGIGDALGQLTSGLNGLKLARGKVGAELGKLESVKTELDTQEVNLKTRQAGIEDVNAAEAAVQLERLQTALQAALAAGQSVLQKENLFDFLA